MRRRGHGDGSIFQRNNGLWVARLDHGYQNGGRKRKDYYGRTRREVQQKLAAAQRALKDGLPVTSDRQKVGQFLERWPEDVARPRPPPQRPLIRRHQPCGSQGSGR